jgi:hypothetical protein
MKRLIEQIKTLSLSSAERRDRVMGSLPGDNRFSIRFAYGKTLELTHWIKSFRTQSQNRSVAGDNRFSIHFAYGKTLELTRWIKSFRTQSQNRSVAKVKSLYAGFRRMSYGHSAVPNAQRLLKLSLSLIIFCLTLNCQQSYGQVSNTYVHAGAKMYVFNGDTMSVWGNSTNYGSWGSAEGGFVHFFGTSWVNNTSASMPGAGTFFFQQPRPAPYANNVAQHLEGGHDWSGSTGCSFPDIHLDNANDLYLINNDAKTRDTFKFVDGHVIHDGFDFTVGDNDPGEILGFNETQFFVTNGTGTSQIGFLERESINNVDLEEAFPIGIAVGDYTPGRVKNIGVDDDFSMRVFANVYEKGYSGTTFNDASVTRTWDVEERVTGGSNVTLELQHNTATEGGVFATNRNNHYITHYVGTSPNGPGSNGVDTTSGSNWDLLKYANLYAGEGGSGYITTGSAIANSLVTKRSGLELFSPYTKTVYDVAPLPVELIALQGVWKGNDGEITWATSSEVNNSHFIVQRSIDGAPFETVGRVNSKAPNGFASYIINYTFTDYGVRQQTQREVFYRLVQTDFDGSTEVHGPVGLFKQKLAVSNFNVYPNPSSGQVNISKTKGAVNEMHHLIVTNMAGQVVLDQEVTSQDIQHGYGFDMSHMPTGIYLVHVHTSTTVDRKLLNLRPDF